MLWLYSIFSAKLSENTVLRVFGSFVHDIPNVDGSVCTLHPTSGSDRRRATRPGCRTAAVLARLLGVDAQDYDLQMQNGELFWAVWRFQAVELCLASFDKDVWFIEMKCVMYMPI